MIAHYFSGPLWIFIGHFFSSLCSASLLLSVRRGSGRYTAVGYSTANEENEVDRRRELTFQRKNRPSICVGINGIGMSRFSVDG